MREVGVLLAITVLVSSMFWALIIHARTLEIAHGRAVHMLMWSPAVAAFATCAFFRINIATLGWNWRPLRYELLGYALPLGYGSLAYFPLWITGLADFKLSEFAETSTRSLGLGDGAAVPASVLGEEIGWRGFLLPRLAHELGFRRAVLVSGAIWSLWHVPLVAFADYNAGTPVIYELACFSVMLLATGTMAAWLRLKSGSLWPPALLHASHNLYIQSLFDPLSGSNGRAAYLTGEFGFALACSTAVVAMIFWSRRSEVDTYRAIPHQVA